MAEKATFEDADYSKKQEVCDNFAQFLKHGSFYEKHPLEMLPDKFSQITPEVVWLYCTRCKIVNPFRIPQHRARSQPEADFGRDHHTIGEIKESVHKKDLESRVYVVALECTGCKFEQHTFWVEIVKDKKFARKVGQIPRPSIEVPRDLEEALQNDIELYRNVKICLNESYGLAACAYLRRILENRITPLLEIIRQDMEEDGASEAALKDLDEIIEGTIASDKIARVGKVLPNALKVEGDNPILLVYDELSYGIHSGDEQKCVELSKRAIPVLNFVLLELGTGRKLRAAKNSFDEGVKNMRREKTQRSQTT